MSNEVHTHCHACGIEFCLTRALYKARLHDGGAFYCPNGHGNVFRPSADEKRIAELERRAKVDARVIDEWRERYDDIYAQREELVRALKECPGGCGWHSRKQVPRDPVAMGRGIERVQRDVAEHLVREHGAGRDVAASRELPERT
jgi:hypothetical protein